MPISPLWGAHALPGLALAMGLWRLAQTAGGVMEARERIGESRDRRGRPRAAADEAPLLAAFRTRLDGLIAPRGSSSADTAGNS